MANLWHNDDRHFAVPDDIDIPSGDFEVRRGLRVAQVDEAFLADYEITAAESRQMSREHLQQRAEEIRDWAATALRQGGKTVDTQGRKVLEVLASVIPDGDNPDRPKLAEALAEQVQRVKKKADGVDLGERFMGLADKLVDVVPDIADRLDAIGQRASGVAEKLREAAADADDETPAEE
jgi:hypothetical protein